MSRPRLIVLSVIGIILLYGAGTWISNRTEWVEYTMPMPLKGEAARNPFYAAQRFAEQLGATTTWDRIFVAPPTDAVIVLSTWQWSLSTNRRLALERWVENGGRLVVDRGIWGGVEEFERWAGVAWHERPSSEDEEAEEDDDASSDDGTSEDAASKDAGSEVAGSEEAQSQEAPSAEEAGVEKDDEAPWVPTCEEVHEDDHRATGPGPMPRHTVCSAADGMMLRYKEPAEWALHSEKGGSYAVRMRVGRGSVTVINGLPFRSRNLFEGDHGWLLVKATQLERGDEIHFLSEDEYPSLLAVVWLHGKPVVLLSGLLIALLLWRGAVRFGPLAAAPELARRSLAEQIRGTGQFVLRGGGAALHAAMVRALEEAVRKRVKRYGELTGDARIKALGRVMRDRARAAALAEAMYGTDAAQGTVLLRTLAKIEAARRHLVREDTRRLDGQ